MLILLPATLNGVAIISDAIISSGWLEMDDTQKTKECKRGDLIKPQWVSTSEEKKSEVSTSCDNDDVRKARSTCFCFLLVE